MRPVTALSMQALAERSGVNVPRLRQLVDLGILSPDAAGRFQPADIQRVRIIQALDRAGIAPAQLGQLIAAGAYSLDWAQVLFPDPTPQVTTTFQQAAAELGLPYSLVAGLYAAWELARPEPEQPLRADDAELLRLAVLGYSAFGHDETVTLGIARQLGQSLRRLAESQIPLFRTRIQEPLAATGPTARRVRADAIIAAPPLCCPRWNAPCCCCTAGTWSTTSSSRSWSTPRPAWSRRGLDNAGQEGPRRSRSSTLLATQPHRGARRPGCRRPGRSAGRACLRGGAPARRPSRQAARRRGDVLLP
jgi:DNA-binding transcriptional MerR regulator